MVVEKDKEPLVDSLITPDTVPTIDQIEEDIVRDELLSATALTAQAWQNAEAVDANISFVIDTFLAKSRPTVQQANSQNIDASYLTDWERYSVKDGVLYKTEVISGEMFNRLVLPEALRDLVFKSYHNDLGHQGCDRTASFIKRRFFWPHMIQYIKERVQSCGRCIRRKTTPSKFAHLVNITTTAPMELVCIDYLSLERSKGGFENILVITDHYSRFAQAIPTRNQSAQTTAKALFENFFVHYGFPAKLHIDQGTNF